MTGKSMLDKIWERHVVAPETQQTPAILYIDLHLIHEVTTPQAFSLLREKGIPVRRPDLTLAGGPPKLGFGLWNEPIVAMPLELGLILLTFTWYVKRTKGPLVPPLVLLAAMLLFQAINWFGPQPSEAGIGMYLMALVSFAVLTALAFWLDETRWHKNRVGLAVASARR